MSNERLSSRYHLDEYSWGIKGEASQKEYFVRQALDSHALSVWGEAQKLIHETQVVADKLASRESQYFIRFGLGRRSRAIWFSFRELYTLVHPSRESPLLLDDADRVSEILNSIYIHLRGAFDNVAWALVASLGGTKKLGLQETQVGLFSRKLRGIEYLKELNTSLQRFDRWNEKEFKRFRDPAAHRVPLSAIPALLDAESLELFSKTNEEWRAKTLQMTVAGHDRDYASSERFKLEAESLWARLQKIGTYKPMFEYSADCEPMSIYPTVPDDIGMYVQIIRTALPTVCQLNEGADSMQP